MKTFLKDIDWHNKALSFVRDKRDTATKKLPEWEALRELASNIKAHTLSYLDTYLEEFEKNCIKNGIQIHWASDDREFRKIVESILKEKKAKKIVKSKSMLTEECGLNPYLESRGYEVIDTDLGERIVQLRGESPTHIVLPAIHLTKEEVAQTFKESNCDPTYLTNIARKSLREEFLSADVAITGVNFAIANEGAFVVCTNEGNADLATSLCDTHIACMGIEKLIPKLEHLGVFTRMLARSATGQAITTYTSHFKNPSYGKEIHLVLVDNGRSDILSKEDFSNSLKCIRCGACMNTCPIFRRAGGENYHYSIPGVIGTTLSCSRDIKKYADLSFASTLCGSCTAVCPVKIDLHEQLVSHRYEYIKKTNPKLFYKILSKLLNSPTLLKLSIMIARVLPHKLYKNSWGKNRITPKLTKKTFSEIFDEQS